jgi:hypothetical protein
MGKGPPTKQPSRNGTPKRGRPVTVKHGTKVAILFPAELVRRVDDYAIEREVTRSTAVRELLDRALSE